MVDYTTEAEKKRWDKRLSQDFEFVQDHLFALDDMIAATHGPHYSTRVRPQYMPWNHYFAYVSTMTGTVVYENPVTRVTTRRPGSQREVATAMQHGLNRWCRDENVRRFGQTMAMDMFYSFGVGMVRQTPSRYDYKLREAFLFDDEGFLEIDEVYALWPSLDRIPQQCFIVDSNATSLEKAEYMGHRWYAYSDEVLAEARGNNSAGWKKEEIEFLVLSARAGDGVTQKVDPGRAGGMVEALRGQLEFASIWIPGFQPDAKKGPDQGYHGAFLTLARMCSMQGRQNKGRGQWVEVKEPEPYYGPPSGPYQVFGAYWLPNRLLPLAPLVASEANVRAVNRQARALERSNEQYRRILAYDMRNTGVAGQLRKSQHDFFVGIPNLTEAPVQGYEIGGATDQQYRGTAWSLEMLQRLTGLDDAQQGAITGIGTATEHQLANAAQQTKIAQIRQEFGDALTQMLHKVGWFMYHDDRVVFPMGEESADALGYGEPWFYGGQESGGELEDAAWMQGGDHRYGSQARYVDLELEIEPMSMMRRGSEEYMQAMQQGLAFILQTLPMRAQMPFADWDAIDDEAAKMFGLPGLDRLVDNDAAPQFAPFVAPAADHSPRFGRQVGDDGQGFGVGGPPRMRAPMGAMEQAGALQGTGGPQMGLGSAA